MIISIDDAGDLGFKFDKGSSRYFVIASIIFDDDLDAEEAGLKIKRLRRDLNWDKLHEFKFRKLAAPYKLRFFDAVKNINYKAVIAIIDKKTINDTLLKNNPSRLYNKIILETLKASPVKLSKAHIYIDGEAGKDYRRSVKAFFRQNLPKNAIKQVTYIDSVKDNLIQLADMVAGSALLSTKTERTDAITYLKIIENHIEKKITHI